MASGPAKIQNTVRFGEDFELDFRSYKLHRSGRVLKLERIPAEILILLVERRAEIVTREQIAERIWGKNAFLDTDNSINGAIRKIRQILRDDPEEPRFIQTITGQGYRFIAPVSEDAGILDSVGQEEEQSDKTPTITPQPTSEAAHNPAQSRRRAWLVLALAIVAVAALAGWLVWSRSRTPQAPRGRVMLAVLPFQNLTGDAAQEYFSDGLTEELITQLGSIDPSRLGVIARTSVMHYKQSETPLEQVGRELGVQYAIEGSVRRDGNEVRITAQLIQMKDQTHVWARQYDRELNKLLTLQSEIAQEVADEIQFTLGEHKPAASPPAVSSQNYEAYDLYLKGQYFFNKRTMADLEDAIRFFQKAIDEDAKSARAYAGLADSYAILAAYSAQPESDFMSKARAAALKALELDPSLPDAHTALALIVQNYDWDWQTSEKEFRRAIELNPNYATAHHWYAEHLMWRGRFDEALQESERARQLDPLSLIIAADNGAIFYFSRQYDRAIEKWQSVKQMDPDFSRANLITGAYVEKGMFTQAISVNEKQRLKNPSVYYWSWRAYIQGRMGKTAEAHEAIQQLLRLDNRKAIAPMIIAQAYAGLGLGEKGQALAWLEKAYAQHSNELTSLKVSPVYDGLRGDRRFVDLLRRVGLED